MIYLALMRVVMPSRRIIDRDNYEKINIGHLYINIPRNILDNKNFQGYMTTFFEPHYIVRPITEDIITAMKLTDVGIKKPTSMGIGRSYSTIPDIILFKANQKEYNKFNREFKLYVSLQSQKPEFKESDYQELEDDIDQLRELVKQRQSPILINQQFNKKRKRVQSVIDEHREKLRNSRENLCYYFTERFEIVDLFNI